MSDILINTTSSIFDMFLVMIYYSKMFTGRKNNISKYMYYASFILMEIILNVVMILTNNIHSSTKLIFTMGISILTLFAITFLYTSRLIHKIFIVLSFQVYCILSEILLIFIFSGYFSIIGNEYPISDYVYNFLSKIICFLLVGVTFLIAKRKDSNYSLKYGILILLTPIFSIMTIIGLTSSNMDTVNFRNVQFVSITGLMFFNIINFYLLDSILQAKELQIREANLMQQIQYQSEKYDMIRTAYRETRRLIHDTKKHYFFIRSAAEKNETAIIPEYINKQLDELETKHILVNTGNLAIDSLVSNYIQVATQDKIPFDTKIRIDPELIETDNYDLCIIIGNLLENSINASRKIEEPEKRHILFEAYTSEKDFVLHISNTINDSDNKSHNSEYDRLNHGYGIENVEKIVERYYGTFSYFIKDGEYNSIIVIPRIKDKKILKMLK